MLVLVRVVCFWFCLVCVGFLVLCFVCLGCCGWFNSGLTRRAWVPNYGTCLCIHKDCDNRHDERSNGSKKNSAGSNLDRTFFIASRHSVGKNGHVLSLRGFGCKMWGEMWVMWWDVMWDVSDVVWCDVRCEWFGEMWCEMWVMWCDVMWDVSDLVGCDVRCEWCGGMWCEMWVMWWDVKC